MTHAGRQGVSHRAALSRGHTLCHAPARLTHTGSTAGQRGGTADPTRRSATDTSCTVTQYLPRLWKCHQSPPSFIRRMELKNRKLLCEIIKYVTHSRHVGENHLLRDTKERRGKYPRVGVTRCSCDPALHLGDTCHTVTSTQQAVLTQRFPRPQTSQDLMEVTFSIGAQ